MRQFISVTVKMVLITLAASAASILLLSAVELLPDQVIKDHASASMESFKELGTNPTMSHGYDGTTIDTYTDAWMLRIACYDGPENPVERSLGGYYYGLVDDDGTGSVVDSTIALLSGADNTERFSYGQYWHGYMLCLRPLLMILDYADIIELLKIIELGLMLAVAVAMYSKGAGRYIPAYAATMAFINYASAASCLQYADIFIIAHVGALIILCSRPGFLAGHKYLYLFLGLGICTSFMDFLTYPMFTLGMCMVMWVIISDKYSNTASDTSVPSASGHPLTLEVITGSIAWAIGYGGEWFMKWVWGSLFTSENVFHQAAVALSERTSTSVDSSSFSYLQVVMENASVVSKWAYVLMILAMIIYSAVVIVRSHPKMYSTDKLLALGLCILMPFAWFLVTGNHSYLHAFMVYRILGISVFAFFAMLLPNIPPDCKS